MTTFEPGASVVFTHGLDFKPFSTAFLARSAAPIITDGLEVFVHEVIDAITTSPFLIVVASLRTLIATADFSVLSERYVGKMLSNEDFESVSEMRSCGRLGPAIDGTTVDRSSSIFSEKRGVSEGSCHRPCFFAYCSTSATASSLRPVRRK